MRRLLRLLHLFKETSRISGHFRRTPRRPDRSRRRRRRRRSRSSGPEANNLARFRGKSLSGHCLPNKSVLGTVCEPMSADPIRRNRSQPVPRFGFRRSRRIPRRLPIPRRSVDRKEIGGFSVDARGIGADFVAKLSQLIECNSRGNGNTGCVLGKSRLLLRESAAAAKSTIAEVGVDRVLLTFGLVLWRARINGSLN